MRLSGRQEIKAILSVSQKNGRGEMAICLALALCGFWKNSGYNALNDTQEQSFGCPAMKN